MSDYDLERLNSRSFEQLIQALGLEIIGDHLVVFGDGPDGGREATFKGEVFYGEGESKWNGFGIVQAKFRQNPDSSPKKNADWAIANLEAEFNKFTVLKKGNSKSVPGERVCPEYYIFATNVNLSSLAMTGGKDRVTAVFEKFKKSKGLKGYAIWDGVQLKSFLDKYAGVRTTFSAWVLSGDVLEEMVRFLSLNKNDFLPTIRRYLEKSLLNDQFAKLGQGGYTDANAIPLSNVFVDLPLDVLGARFPTYSDSGTGQGRLNFLENFFEEGRQVLKPSLVDKKPSVERAGRVVLIGGPGQGKTTLGQFACQLLRAALLKTFSTNFSPETKQALSWIEDQSEGFPKIQNLRYPLHVDLKKLAEALAGEGEIPATSLLDYLVKHIGRITDSSISNSEFRKWLSGYPWLLVLDGLDEVPASSNRTKMMDSIRDFVSVEAVQQDADLLVLATSRPQGYSDEFNRKFYYHLPLAPLNAKEALKYGLRLAGARHPNLTSRVEDLAKSLERATLNPATVRLMESPLQVTIMLALIEGGGEPPEQRWKLFHDYYDVIYRREKERGTPFSALLGKYEPDIHWLHHRAGWTLQQRNAAVGATASKLTHEEFEQLVDLRLVKQGHCNPEQRGELVSQIKKAATDRLVFLVGNTADEIGFEIRSLQEFMAAEHCFDGSELRIQDTVRCIAPYPYWRNVFLFIAGRIFFERESLIDTLVAVCERLNENLTDQGLGMTASGSRLALTMLKDGVSRNQPENSRVLSRCASRLLDRMTVDEVPDIVELFSGDASDVWQDELVKRLRNSGETFPYVEWYICIRLIHSGIEFANEMLKEFPWDAKNLEGFLLNSLSSYNAQPEIFKVQLRRNIIRFPAWILKNSFSDADGANLSVLPDKLSGVASLFVERNDRNNYYDILFGNGDKTIHSLNLKRGEGLDRWASFEIDPEVLNKAHVEWQIFHEVSEFARSPSPQTLIQCITKIKELEPNFDSHIEEFCPWQIRLCLVALKSGSHSLEDIVKLILNGSIGTAEDWERWIANRPEGIRITSLGTGGTALHVSETRRGAMFEQSGWMHSLQGLNPEFEFVEALRLSLPLLDHKSKLVETLVSLCCFGIQETSTQWGSDRMEEIGNFITTCRDCRVNLPRILLFALMDSGLEPEEMIELIAMIGSNVNPNSFLDNWSAKSTAIGEVGVDIVYRLRSSVKARDVIAALSYLPPLSFSDELIGLCRGRPSTSDLDLDAEIVILANSLSWNESGSKIAKELLRLSSKYPRQLDELIEHIDASGVHGFAYEEFLIFYIQSDDAKITAHFKVKVKQLLLKLVERRPAVEVLPDPASKTEKPT